jgi:hypothetical protein
MQRDRSAQKTIIMDMDMVLMNLRVCVISLVNEFDNNISEYLVKKHSSPVQTSLSKWTELFKYPLNERQVMICLEKTQRFMSHRTKRTPNIVIL